MPDAVRWGVLGNATIARKCVLPAISKSRNGSIAVLGTQRPAEAAGLVKDLRIEAVVDDYAAVLKDPRVDAVYIPLPNHLHHPWTIRALEAGKHVLCEKPLACSALQAAEMAAAARSNQKILMEALMYRFHPRSRRIKQLVDHGAVGIPRLVRTAFTFPMDPAMLDQGNHPRLTPSMGGGALLDVGCYGVSVAVWLLGALPEAVEGMAIRQAGQTRGVDLHFAGTMAFRRGALAQIEAGFVSALQQTYAVMGSLGAIELPHDAFIPWEKEAAYVMRGPGDETGPRHSVAGTDEYRLMVEHFGAVVTEGASQEISVAESIDNMRILDALAESSLKEKRIQLDLNPHM